MKTFRVWFDIFQQMHFMFIKQNQKYAKSEKKKQPKEKQN